MGRRYTQVMEVTRIKWGFPRLNTTRDGKTFWARELIIESQDGTEELTLFADEQRYLLMPGEKEVVPELNTEDRTAASPPLPH